MEKSLRFLKVQFCVFVISYFIITITYIYLDKPVASWVYAHRWRSNEWLQTMTYIPLWLSGVVCLLYPIIVIRNCFGKYEQFDRAALLIANSLVIALFFKDVMKFTFSRPSVEVYLYKVAGYVKDNIHGFNWFELDKGYTSFPSGHASVASAALIAFAIAYPRLRGFAVLGIMCVTAGLVGLYYHYLSDVLAGILLGYLIAVSGAQVMKLNRADLSAVAQKRVGGMTR